MSINIHNIEHKIIILSQKRSTPSLLISTSTLPACHAAMISRWKDQKERTGRRQTLWAPAQRYFVLFQVAFKTGGIAKQQPLTQRGSRISNLRSKPAGLLSRRLASH